jgi:hypothetical protein
LFWYKKSIFAFLNKFQLAEVISDFFIREEYK